MKLPDCFRQKIALDTVLRQMKQQDVVNFQMFKTAKSSQVVARRQCESWQFPSKAKG